MKQKNYSEANYRNGVFWYKDDCDTLLIYPFGCVDSDEGIAKSRNTYNHEKLWNDINPDYAHSYNYYPRGRVHFDKSGTPTIYANPNITLKVIEQVKDFFDIKESDKCTIKYDYSNHYKCHLDKEECNE